MDVTTTVTPWKIHLHRIIIQCSPTHHTTASTESSYSKIPAGYGIDCVICYSEAVNPTLAMASTIRCKGRSYITANSHLAHSMLLKRCLSAPRLHHSSAPRRRGRQTATAATTSQTNLCHTLLFLRRLHGQGFGALMHPMLSQHSCHTPHNCQTPPPRQ